MQPHTFTLRCKVAHVAKSSFPTKTPTLFDWCQSQNQPGKVAINIDSLAMHQRLIESDWFHPLYPHTHGQLPKKTDFAKHKRQETQHVSPVRAPKVNLSNPHFLSLSDSRNLLYQPGPCKFIGPGANFVKLTTEQRFKPMPRVPRKPHSRLSLNSLQDLVNKRMRPILKTKRGPQCSTRAGLFFKMGHSWFSYKTIYEASKSRSNASPKATITGTILIGLNKVLSFIELFLIVIN